MECLAHLWLEFNPGPVRGRVLRLASDGAAGYGLAGAADCSRLDRPGAGAVVPPDRGQPLTAPIW